MTEPEEFQERHSRTVPYRCLSCWHEFKAGPGPTKCPACGHLYVGRLGWFAVATNPRAEAAVSAKLRSRGITVLFLHYWVKIRPRNREREVMRAVMPGYIFVHMVASVDSYAVATMPGVSMLLSNESGPAEIRASEIERLWKGADPDGRVAFEEPGTVKRKALEAGRIVRILSGPFQGFEGPVVQDEGKDMLKVTATIFGRETDVLLPWQAVEAA